jgi:hypothetical protein
MTKAIITIIAAVLLSSTVSAQQQCDTYCYRLANGDIVCETICS